MNSEPKKIATILCDTRQQKDKHITDYLKGVGIAVCRTKLYAGDYHIPFDQSCVVEYKKDLLELAGNLCSTDHDRFIREIERAKALGFKRFVILICQPDITSVEEIGKWLVPTTWRGKKRETLTKVKPETLQKTVSTMIAKYGIEVEFCNQLNAGQRLVEILTQERGSEDGKED